MMPLLFAVWERFSKEDVVRVLKLVSVISFRYTVVSGLNTNPLEPTYHRAAQGGDGRPSQDPGGRVRVTQAPVCGRCQE